MDNAWLMNRRETTSNLLSFFRKRERRRRGRQKNQFIIRSKLSGKNCRTDSKVINVEVEKIAFAKVTIPWGWPILTIRKSKLLIFFIRQKGPLMILWCKVRGKWLTESNPNILFTWIKLHLCRNANYFYVFFFFISVAKWSWASISFIYLLSISCCCSIEMSLIHFCTFNSQCNEFSLSFHFTFRGIQRQYYLCVVIFRCGQFDKFVHCLLAVKKKYVRAWKKM